MKITGYSSQVNTVSGASNANTVNYSAVAKAAGSDVVDMSPVAKGLGDWAKTIDAIHEQEDKQSILAAMDSYNKDMDNLLNGDEGLLKTKEAGAIGITNTYMAKAGEMQADVLGKAKFHFKNNKLALDNFFSKASQQGFEQVRNHQLQQNEKLQLTHLGNIQADMNLNASKFYNEPTSLEAYKNQIGIAVEMVYGKYGPERLEAEKKKAYGEYAATALQAAVTNNDYTAQNEIMKAYGDLLPSNTRNNYEKLSIKKQKQQWLSSTAQKALDSSGGDLAKALDYANGITERSVMTFGNNDLVAQFRDRIGKEAYYLDGVEGSNNTGCAAAITKLPGLQGTEYQGVTWVPTLMEIAKKNNEWRNGTEGIQPGDLIITNGDGHVSMWTGEGEIQNGKSGSNNIGSAGGKGGVHESSGMPSNVTGYISMQKYSHNNSGGRLETVDEEDRQDLINAIIRKHNQNKQIENIRLNSFQKNIEQQVFDFKKNNPNATSADAVEKFANMGNFSNVREYEAALAGVASIYGSVTKNTSGVKGPGTGKGDQVAVYDITKLIENDAFGGDRVRFVNYINSDDCNMLNNSNRAKLLELFDDYQNKDGAYKYNWGQIDEGFVNGAKVSAQEREQIKAYGRASALELLKTWKPAEHQGRIRPSISELIAEGRKGVTEKYTTHYETDSWYGKTTKTLEIPKGALDEAGFHGGIKEESDTMVTLYKDANRTQGISISKDALRAMFPTIEGK